MTPQEINMVQKFIKRYNELFVEADLLKYENRSFQRELLGCYQEIAFMKAFMKEGGLISDGDTEKAKFIPNAFEDASQELISFMEPIPPEIEITPKMQKEDEDTGIAVVSPEQFAIIMQKLTEISEKKIQVPVEKALPSPCIKETKKRTKKEPKSK